MTLRISTPALEGFFQASKWLKFQVLVEKEDLEILFQQLEGMAIYPLTGLLERSRIPLSQELFLQEYGRWIEGLKRGVVPTDGELRTILACAWSANESALWLQEVPGEKFLVKMAEPVIQCQAHFFTYSPVDQVFRPMSMGSNAIFWGLQISYPQIYQHPKTMELLKVEESVNSELFSLIRQWVRDRTRPTPFVVAGTKTNVPIRIGKNCFSWIAAHPQLKNQGISIDGA